MGRAIYSAPVGAAVTLSAGVAKTVLAVIAPSQFGTDLRGFKLALDGVTATDKPVLVELCSWTTDGTGTSATIAQVAGRSITTGFTAKYNYTVEPSASETVLDRWTLSPIGGLLVVEYGDESPDANVSRVFGLRCTAPTSAVNCNATLRFARC